MPAPAHPPIAGAAPASPSPDLPWDTWARLVAGLWQGMELGLGLQQQCVQRWSQRQHEAWRHWQHGSAPTVWLDFYLAGMRWGLQEWDQALQDGMTMPVLLRAQDVGQNLDWLGPCHQWAQLPWQLWGQCWAEAGRQRPR